MKYVCNILARSIHFATVPESKFAGSFLKYGSSELFNLLSTPVKELQSFSSSDKKQESYGGKQ